MAKLTEKQKMFVQEYLIDLNATQAAIRAGYSPKTANEQGSRLLAKVSIKEEIEREMAKRSRRTGISQDRVLQEYAKVAFANIEDIVNTDGTLKETATREDMAAVSSIKTKKTEDGEERELKLYDKLKALEALGRHLGIFKNEVDVSLKDSRKLDAIMSQMGGGGLEE